MPVNDQPLRQAFLSKNHIGMPAEIGRIRLLYEILVAEHGDTMTYYQLFSDFRYEQSLITRPVCTHGVSNIRNVAHGADRMG